MSKDSSIEPGYHYSEGERAAIREYSAKVCEQISGASDESFTALAIGDIDDDPALDVWIINDYKQIFNLVPDWDREELTYPDLADLPPP